MLGLSSLLIPVAMPEVITNNFSNIMKALTYLSSKSVEIRTKEHKGEDMAEEENDGQGAVCEDEDSQGIDLDSEEDDDMWDLDEDAEEATCLYASPLDSVDEVMFLAECLQKL